MWNRFTRWCYPNVGREVPRSLRRTRADLRPLVLLGFALLAVKLFIFIM